MAHDTVATRLFGQHAKLNFPAGITPPASSTPGMALLAPKNPGKKQKTETKKQKQEKKEVALDCEGDDGGTSTSQADDTSTGITTSSALAVSYLGVEFHPASGRWIVPAGGRLRAPLKNNSSGGR